MIPVQLFYVWLVNLLSESQSISLQKILNIEKEKSQKTESQSAHRNHTLADSNPSFLEGSAFSSLNFSLICNRLSTVNLFQILK
jgi:hypothetical protein